MFEKPNTIRQKKRRGLSLLEVVLALAILGIAVGILAQSMQLSADNALRSQRMAQAQLFCETKMAEVISGAVPIQAQDWAPISTMVGNGAWYFSIQTMAPAQPNMIGVVITVTDDINSTSAADQYRLVRWIIDPSLGMDQPQQPSDQTGTTGSGAGGSTGGTGSSTGGR